MTTSSSMDDALESEIAILLCELSTVQGDLLDLLREKRELLAAGDSNALATIAQREHALMGRLQSCHDRRQRMLAQAADSGRPADSIRSLSRSLPTAYRDRLRLGIDEARQQGRILQHECLTNWVLVQRTLLHLSQMIEIIATGGRMKPTYENGSDGTQRDAIAGGALVDRAA